MKFTTMFFVYVFFTLSGFMYLTIAHEDAHKQDCIYRGGEVLEYEIVPWDAHITCSLGTSPQDSLIEAHGYPATILFGFFVTGLFLASMPYLVK